MRIFLKLLCLFFILKQIFVYKFVINANERSECVGKHQIPLRIEANYDVISQPFEEIIFHNFDTVPEETILANNGQTIVIEMKYSIDREPIIDMGPVAGLGIFRFGFLYFQWYEKSWEAYNFKNLSLPAEIHALFYDAESKSFEEAIQLKKLTVVLAFGLEIFPMGSDNFQPLENNLSLVRNANSRVSIKNLGLYSWLTKRLFEFYLYEGIMMILDCEVPVLWVDFIPTITVKPKTAEEFHNLKSSNGQPLLQQFTSNLKPAYRIIKSFIEDGENTEENMSGIPFVNAYNSKHNPNSAVRTRTLQKLKTIQKDKNFENITALPGDSIAFVDTRNSADVAPAFTLLSIIWAVFFSLILGQ